MLSMSMLLPLPLSVPVLVSMPVRLFLVVVLVAVKVPSVRCTGIHCYSVFDCESKVGPDSECLENGYCSNPYHRKGCLARHNKTASSRYKIRTCHSEDPPESIEKGYCVASNLGYTEIRLGTQNWESAMFSSWIMQILLSELLDVPATIETGSLEANVDFYDLRSRFEYGNPYDFEGMKLSNQILDCRNRAKNQTCVHAMSEVWSPQVAEALEELRQDHHIETPRGLGALGQQMWYMRKATALRYPEFGFYAGLQGEEARLKLASVFKRPTTWQDYCSIISSDACKTPDEYAQRPPEEGEEGFYFLEGFYRGYFGATEKNNCTALPGACTGHIVDMPCGWTAYVVPQTQHLGIALESNGNESGCHGYTYEEMVQILFAAHETDADIMIVWWRPTVYYEYFLGTNSELTQITLPSPTQECIDNRVSYTDRCSLDTDLHLGDPLGSCMEEPHPLDKVMATSLYKISFDPNIPSPLHSPAYDAIMNFRITDLQLGAILLQWFDNDFDRYGLDPRDAVCDWVVENLEQIETFIPKTHPRIILDDGTMYQEPIFIVAMVTSCAAIVLGFFVMALTYQQRTTRPAIRMAQIEFLLLVLLGILMVSLGALLESLVPTDAKCMAIAWLINLGYTLQLVPLIVKVAAIHRLMVASQQRRHVELKMVSLFGAVFVVVVIVGVVLIIWTVLDPYSMIADVELTTETSPGDAGGQTVIKRIFYCSSDKDIWIYLGVAWQLLLLLCASFLAFQTRKIRVDLNESRTLAKMSYAHFVFVILIAVTYLLADSIDNATLAASRSIIYSLDSMATLIIYFFPKFFQKANAKLESQNQGSTMGSANEFIASSLRVHISQSQELNDSSQLSNDNRVRVASSNLRRSLASQEVEHGRSPSLCQISEERNDNDIPSVELDLLRCKKDELDPSRCKEVELDPSRCKEDELDPSIYKEVELDPIKLDPSVCEEEIKTDEK